MYSIYTMVVLYCIIYNIYIPLYNIIFTIIMVAQKSIVNYPNYHGLILGDGLFISLSTRVTLDLQTIYIYIYYIFISIYPHISPYVHRIYIYIIYIHPYLYIWHIYPTLQVEALMGLAWPDAMAEVTSAPFRRNPGGG